VLTLKWVRSHLRIVVEDSRSVMKMPATATNTPTRVMMASLDQDGAELDVVGEAEVSAGTGAAWTARLYTKQARRRFDRSTYMVRR
jgi:hypothetical protein